MCLLVIHYKIVGDAPLLIAANREEFYDRPSLPPRVQPGNPSVLCGLDARAGGTWLGVNEFGVVAAVTNRRKPSPPASPRSRGLLCRELLSFDAASRAAEYAFEQLSAGTYDGANFVCLDEHFAAVIHAGPKLEVVTLKSGQHILTAGDVNDAADPRQALARRLSDAAGWQTPEQFVAAAQGVCSYVRETESESIVIRRADRGTVSSSILVLAQRPEDCQFHFAPGPPDRTAYEDFSHLLQETLA